MVVFNGLLTLFFFGLFAWLSRYTIGRPDGACTLYIGLTLMLEINLLPGIAHPLMWVAMAVVLVVAYWGCLYSVKEGWAAYPPHIVSLLFIADSLALPVLPNKMPPTHLGVGGVLLEAAFLLAGYVGVGGGLDRGSFRKAMVRLGLDRPLSLKGAMGSVLLVIPLLVFGSVWIHAFHLAGLVHAGNRLALPDVRSARDRILSGIVIAAAAAFGEEILFRGALQPVYGIPLTSLVWAAGHVQYGTMDLVTVAIFLQGLVLGFVRKRFGTRATILTHFVWDASVMVSAVLLPVR